MEVGLIRSIDIDHEMQQAYLDYAMSVIVARALPDARDGLKPVHRRILYAMYDMGLRPETSYKKSARIVGEVLGKYHPHGDMAVYEAMARMAQDFSMRCMLVDGQGNFGSVDGDPPAAMRYTEARLAAPAMNLLADIQKNTVDFSDNFDGSLKEPDVLPAAIPNLLVNGATGIAVGMSTSIPPHNLGEVVDALNYMLDHWDDLDEIDVDTLMQFIKGPDFPTGGVIIQGAGDEEGMHSAYGSGRGRVTVQARAHIEEMSRGRNRIIVTELPYMTNKASLIERIAELVRDGRLDGIADLRDESDRHGMRIVIELSKTAEPEAVLKGLFHSTPMRSTFGIIMLALVDGEPRHLSLKQALKVYLEHRLVVIRRRSEHDLDKARQRAHILEGYRVALKNLDEVIDLIRKAADVETARTRLMKRFRLSEIQAQAILEMPLRRLAALERKKIEEEYKEVQGQIKELESLLRSPKKMRQVVGDDLRAMKDAYSDRRRTQIVYLDGKAHSDAALLVSDLAPDRTVWVAVSTEGLIWRTMDDNPPRSSGREAPRFLARVNTRDTLYLVSEQGEAAAVPVHSITEAESQAEGTVLWKASALTEQDKLAGLFTLPPKEERAEEGYVFTTTRQGMVKKTAFVELPGPSAHTFPLVKVNEGDRLGWLRLTDGKADVLLVTADGMAIRFSENEVRPMGLVAAGVGGIKLQNRDELVGMELVSPKAEVLLVASDGKAKRLAPDQFPQQGRYGQGVVAWKLPRSVSLVGTAAGKGTARITLHLEKLAAKVMRLDEAPLQTRAAQGKPVVDLKAGDSILALSIQQDTPRPLSKATLQKNGEKTARSGNGNGAEKKPRKVEEPGEEYPSDGQEAFDFIQPDTDGEERSQTKQDNKAQEIKPAPKPKKSAQPRAVDAKEKPTRAASSKEKAATGKVKPIQAELPKVKAPAKKDAQSQPKIAQPSPSPAKEKTTQSKEKPVTSKPAEKVKTSASKPGKVEAKTPVISKPVQPEKPSKGKESEKAPARKKPVSDEKSTGIKKDSVKPAAVPPAAEKKPAAKKNTPPTKTPELAKPEPKKKPASKK